LLEFADGANPLLHPATEQVLTSTESIGEASDLPRPILLSIPNGLTANILSNTRLTSSTHWQDVRHLCLKIPSTHRYIPGDVLTIYPRNFPIDVSSFIETQNWTSIADVPLIFTQPVPSPSSSSSLPLPNIPSGSTVTLRELLTSHLDILSIPRRSFFAHLAHFTTDDFHRARLLEFTDPQYIDELYDYTTRPRRSILEVLQEFESVKIPWQRICSVIPALRGRQFSIASAFKEEGEEGTKLELCIAIVKYKTVIKRIREGVCTRYISSFRPGQEITVTLHEGGLGVTKTELDRPVVMIGPGTGVAPMRSLIWQRKYWREELQSTGMDDDKDKEVPRDLLFFGCRNAEADFLFKDEWEALKNVDAPLDVFPAFSRDQVSYFTTSTLEDFSLTFYISDKRSTSKIYFVYTARKFTRPSTRRAVSFIFAVRRGRCRKLYVKR
jgi:sulfite reductase alpha subunit-like flavoprotein